MMQNPIDDLVAEVESRSTFVDYEDIAPELMRATISIEDRRFYEHDGIDLIGLGRALISQVYDGFLKSGGSTITQQVAKNLYEEFDSSLEWKPTEIFLANYLDHHYSKNEILAIYVNIINYGNNYTGIYEASVGYFDVFPMDLNMAQASLLAGVPQSPSNYDLVNHFDNAKQKQLAVLNAMAECGYINESEIETIYNTTV